MSLDDFLNDLDPKDRDEAMHLYESNTDCFEEDQDGNIYLNLELSIRCKRNPNIQLFIQFLNKFIEQTLMKSSRPDRLKQSLGQCLLQGLSPAEQSPNMEVLVTLPLFERLFKHEDRLTTMMTDRELPPSRKIF